MEEWWVTYQALIRLTAFVLVLAFLGLIETFYSWRPWFTNRYKRWVRHFSLMSISQLCIKLLFPTMAVGIAVIVQKNNIGILNSLSVPFALKMILGMLAFDFVIYFQHRIMHKYTLLWRFHRVHHIDKEIDVTTGLRFHPIEMVFTMAMKAMAIGFFGIPALAVLIYEILLNFSALFTHINTRFHPAIDRALRTLIVTPGMHRIHHSDTPSETNSNYGFCLSIWDRMLGSYQFRTKTGEDKIVFGVEEFQDAKFQTFENMLLIPFNVKSLRQKKIKSPKLSFESE